MQILPTDALIVTDVQNDFCPGGALPIAEGHRIVPAINQLLTRFEHIVYTRDWHPENHCSFAEPPQFVDKSWPVHCVACSPGAEFHGDLHVPADADIVSKGTDPDHEAYSGFEGTNLDEVLGKDGIRRVFVCGLATDYCVRATALDAIRRGLEVVIIEDACRGVNVPQGTVAAAIGEMRDAGAVICNSGELL